MTLAERVSRLERQNRGLRAVGLLAIAAFAAVVCMGQVGVPKLVEAGKFILRDADGKQRAVLELTKETQPSLVLFDMKGEHRLSLALDKDGQGELALYDPAHNVPAAHLKGARLELKPARGLSGWARLGPGDLTLAGPQYRMGTSYATLHIGTFPFLSLYKAAAGDTATLGGCGAGEWGLSISHGKGRPLYFSEP